MDAEARLLLVLALSVLPVGVAPLAVWLHDLIGALLEAFGLALILMAILDR